VPQSENLPVFCVIPNRYAAFSAPPPSALKTDKFPWTKAAESKMLEFASLQGTETTFARRI